MGDKSLQVKWAVPCVTPRSSSNSSHSSETDRNSPPQVRRPQLKSLQRTGRELHLPRRVTPDLSPAVKSLLQQIHLADDDDIIHLTIEAGALAESADHLAGLAPELAKRRPGRLGINLVLHQPQQGQCAPLDLSPLQAFAQSSQGLHLQELQLEISLAQNLPSGFSELIIHGQALKRLSLVFVDVGPIYGPVLEAYLLQCLRLRKHALDKLELTDFDQVIRSSTLATLLNQGLKLQYLSLNLSQGRQRLQEDFRVADLIAGALSTLQLNNLSLGPEHMRGVGKVLGETRRLTSLAIQSCLLAGQSEELFCGLVNNQSLQKLAFLHNRVEVESVPAWRLPRLLLNAPKLQSLHVDCFENDDFYAALNDLRRQNRQLEVQLHPSLAGRPPRAFWRGGWHPSLDEQMKLEA